MNAKEIIELETRLLVVKYGLNAVLEVLSEQKSVSVDELRERMDRLVAARSRRRGRISKSPIALVQELQLPPERKDAIKTIASHYVNRRLFPNLRDVSAFLRRHGVDSNRFKSRNDAFPKLLKTLVALDARQLKSIIDDSDRSDSADFALLADRLMGKSKD